MSLWDGPFKPLDSESSRLLQEAVKNLKPFTKEQLAELKKRTDERTKPFRTPMTGKDWLMILP